MPAAGTQPHSDLSRRARGQIMALVARDAVEDISAPGEGGGDGLTKARILEYYRYNAFGSVTVLPVYDRNDSSYSHVESAGAYSHTADDIPGSGSRSAWDMIENTPLDLSDNNLLMYNRRTGSDNHVAAGEVYGRDSAFDSCYISSDLHWDASVGLFSASSPLGPSLDMVSWLLEIAHRILVKRCVDLCNEEWGEGGGMYGAVMHAACILRCHAEPLWRENDQAELNELREAWGAGTQGGSMGNCTSSAFKAAPSTRKAARFAQGWGELVNGEWRLSTTIFDHHQQGMKHKDADKFKACTCEDLNASHTGNAKGKGSDIQCGKDTWTVCIYLGDPAGEYPDCRFHYVWKSPRGQWMSKGGLDRVRRIGNPGSAGSAFPSAIDTDGIANDYFSKYNLCTCFCADKDGPK